MWLSTQVLKLSYVGMYVNNESIICGLVHQYTSVMSLSYVGMYISTESIICGSAHQY